MAVGSYGASATQTDRTSNVRAAAEYNGIFQPTGVASRKIVGCLRKPQEAFMAIPVGFRETLTGSPRRRFRCLPRDAGTENNVVKGQAASRSRPPSA